MRDNDQKIKWIWPSKLPDAIDEALGEFSPIERKLLHARNILSYQQAEAFLNNNPPEVDDPFMMKDIEKAVQRILDGKKAGEQIVVYGDYDADGITATALLLETLQGAGIAAKHYIPDRMTEGYGLHNEALSQLRSSGTDLVITVDCGIRSVEEIKNAKSMGIDVIITDHHAPGPDLPDAYAIIDPKQQEDNYPFKGFAGVGLAYKLHQALWNTLGKDSSSSVLELVAIGTIADLAPLYGENRFLVVKGLDRMNRTNRPGLRALMEIARVENKTVNADTIGFALGPRINAAGRLESASQALELLITQDEHHARELAVDLDTINRRRQKLTGEIVEQARLQALEDERTRYLIFAAHPEFHEGIVGLAASRLSEEFYKPAIVASKGEDFTRGSARSIPGFHITKAFDQCADLFQQYGGHSTAAGFTVQTADLEILWERLEKIVAKGMADIEFVPSVQIEAEVNFNEITSDLLGFVESLQPCGMGNPKPLIGARDVQVVSKRCVGRDKSHLKLMLKREGRMFDAIAFRKGELEEQLPQVIDIAFYIERNVYMGYENIQLNVQEICW